uniref:Uncharacterized protein n=1 Tax=Dicentrarchus labrax TaxID=13489 RepID=A0A8C4DK23_DICLA
ESSLAPCDACHQSMQAKQTSLLKRVDALDEECEELQRQLGEREERQIDLHNQLQQVSEEKEKVQARLAQQQLQKEKQTLETHVGELKNSVAELKEYVQTLMERERVLVAFPELSPLQAQPQSTGNVLLDMERQLQANNIRMKVLEQENITLHTSLVKLRERTQNDAGRVGRIQIYMSAVQRGWDTVTEGRKQDGGKVVWSQLGRRIACPPPPPPPRPCNFTFKPSTSTRAPPLLRATREHAVVLYSLTPRARIRGGNETLSLSDGERKNSALYKATATWLIKALSLH